MASNGEWRSINRRTALSHVVNLEQTRISNGLPEVATEQLVSDAKQIEKFLNGE